MTGPVRLLLLLGLLLALASPASAAETGPLGQLRSRALALVNEERTSRGLERLRPGEDLDEAAQAHAADMLRRGYFAHESPDGRTVLDRYVAAGGPRWRLVAGNIARCMGCESPPTVERVERLHEGWMNSPEHRRNILLPGLDRFGFGIIVGDGHVLYAVQNFAGPGLPRGLAAGEQPVRLQPEEQAAAALDAINQARAQAGVAELQASPALARAAQALLPQAGAATDRLAPTGDLIAAIPENQQSGWQAVSVVLGSCGGCGAAPAAADIRSFQEQWMADPAYRRSLLDPRMTHLGFALDADGEGAKTALAMLGAER